MRTEWRFRRSVIRTNYGDLVRENCHRSSPIPPVVEWRPAAFFDFSIRYDTADGHWQKKWPFPNRSQYSAVNGVYVDIVTVTTTRLTMADVVAVAEISKFAFDNADDR